MFRSIDSNSDNFGYFHIFVDDWNAIICFDSSFSLTIAYVRGSRLLGVRQEAPNARLGHIFAIDCTGNEYFRNRLPEYESTH